MNFQPLLGGDPSRKIPRENIFIGTSGFSYPDWRGTVYPSRIKPTRYLSWYCQHFPAVEINYTYYRFPEIRHVQNMIGNAGKDFLFSIKANKMFTHSDTFSAEELKRFLSLLQPLRDSGKLGAVLFQFPFSFKNDRNSWNRLASIAKVAGSDPVVVEFRHNSWISDDVFKRLSEMKFSFCSLDLPSLSGLPGLVSALTGPVGYIRFHGRNSAKWWNHEQAWERYDYLYSENELKQWVPVILNMSSECERVMVFFNNHYSGQAVKNAQMLMALLE